jgi:hypothetical protein
MESWVDRCYRLSKMPPIAMIGHPNSEQRRRLWDLLIPYGAFCGMSKDLVLYKNIMNSASVTVNQPTEPWDIILNNRFFEGLGFGHILFQKKLKTTLIEDMGFQDGKDFYYWKDFDELVSLLEAYKKGKIPKIKKSTINKIKKYSMQQQIMKMMGIIFDKFEL